MSAKLKLDPTKSDILRSFFSLDSTFFDKIVEGFSRFNCGSMKVERMVSSLDIGDSEPLIAEIIYQSIALRRFSLEFSFGPSEVGNALRSALKVAGWEDAEIADRADAIDRFLKIVFSPYILYSSKFYDIFLSNERNIRSTKIYTELRPVFDEERTDVVGVININRLNISVSSPDGQPSVVCFHMDFEDLTRLRSECDLALRKISLLKEKISSIGTLGLCVPGEV